VITSIKNPTGYFRLSFLVLFAALLVVGCAEPQPAIDPLIGFRMAAKEVPNKTIVDDYQRYLRTLSPEEQKYAGPIIYYLDGNGQHAIKIKIGINGASWEHVLIYDKDNRRIKTVKYTTGHYAS
jgi:hypothetical protein